jgi:hypothetical protein
MLDTTPHHTGCTLSNLFFINLPNARTVECVVGLVSCGLGMVTLIDPLVLVGLLCCGSLCNHILQLPCNLSAIS